MMYQKIVLLVATIVCSTLAMYFTYFHRAPVDNILAANYALQAQGHEVDESAGIDDDSPAVTSSREWDRWIRDNKFISIGKIYDKCGKLNLTSCNGGLLLLVIIVIPH